MAAYTARRGSPWWQLETPLYLLIGALAVCSVTAAIAAPADKLSALTAIFGVAAIIAGLMVAGARDGLSVSAGFIVVALAAVFLGARSAMAIAILAELSSALTLRTRVPLVILNLPAAVLPAIVAALASHAIAPAASHSIRFYVAVAVAAAIVTTLSFIIFATLRRAFLPELDQFGPRAFVEHLPSTVLTVCVVVAGAGMTVKLGTAGSAFALSAVFAFAYMAHLLAQSRNRAEQYVSLSWGVLAGLMRSLDIRDERAARHAAAVARFSGDMAGAVGMSEADQELAHTAGLLHDIGHFALSDRVAERGRALTDDDWDAIQQHPELGADMLKDLGMYGPVAAIVLAHHERIDGRGYPNGLVAEEIPEIAKIISVAEAYDTLTASDTYRTRMSSFEALRELRRVSGTQLDGRYVEVLAGLLSGEGVEYRHADTADFDTELAMERRISEARTG
ncbi:MAG: HD domain-containing protein [Solirubrobacterales bacterium]|nr:HD domain-containing protein [Solirubrobacterales bacterium]MBV9715965.1 HD domain-containing protein [Solirubrobacterales bacterium]